MTSQNVLTMQKCPHYNGLKLKLVPANIAIQAAPSTHTCMAYYLTYCATGVHPISQIQFLVTGPIASLREATAVF